MVHSFACGCMPSIRDSVLCFKCMYLSMLFSLSLRFRVYFFTPDAQKDGLVDLRDIFNEKPSKEEQEAIARKHLISLSLFSRLFSSLFFSHLSFRLPSCLLSLRRYLLFSSSFVSSPLLSILSSFLLSPSLFLPRPFFRSFSFALF